MPREYGFTSFIYDQHPDAKQRAFVLVDAFADAGLILQCDENGWSVRIEGDYLGQLCTLYHAPDTEKKEIERYVWEGIGNPSSLVALYVKDAEDTGY